MRTGATPIERLPGTRRILMLGDSYLFGAGVRVEEALPAALEARLNRDAPQHVWEVLNLARRGASLVDQLGHFRRFLDCVGIGYAAEHVVVLVNYTDAEPQPLRMRFPTDPCYLESTWRPEPATRAFLSHCVAGLRAACATIGADLTLLHFDHLRLPVSPMGLELLRDIEARTGVEVIDSTPAFANHLPAALRVDDVDEHPNPLAHRLAADLLASRLVTRFECMDSANQWSAWRKAAGALPASQAAACYIDRMLGHRGQSDASLIRPMLRVALEGDAWTAAGRHFAGVLARVRPFDGKLEFALQQVELSMAAIRAARDSVGGPVVQRRWVAAQLTDAPSLNKLAATCSKLTMAAARNTDESIALQSLANLIQQYERLTDQCGSLDHKAISTSAAELRDDVCAGLAHIHFTLHAIASEMRVSELAHYLATLPETPTVTVRLRIQTRTAATRSILVNWQPVIPLRPLAREGCAIGGETREWEVELHLPLVGEAQLSIGGDLDGVDCDALELRFGEHRIALDPQRAFVPHRRWRIVPALQLAEEIVMPVDSAAWSALAAVWP